MLSKEGKRIVDACKKALSNLKTKKMKRKFKVGDRVEVVSMSGMLHNEGYIFTIQDTNNTVCGELFTDGTDWYGEHNLKLINDMRKEDLKTGMRVELRNGDIYVVCKNTGTDYGDILSSNNTWIELGDFNEDITFKERGSYTSQNDIVKVYKFSGFLDSKGELLWEREEEAEEMTMEEICKELGREVKVKK
jgi:hypothetical protein